MTNDFNASRDLSPREFEIFKKQYSNSFQKYRQGLRESHEQLKEAERRAAFYSASINAIKATCLKHGINPLEL